MNSVAIAHVNLILSNEVIEDGALLAQDGVIVQVGPRDEVAWRDAETVIDGEQRMYLMPGVVDTHCDGLEVEVNPRPRVNFEGAFAMLNYERRALAAGVTTSFHAISFQDMPRVERTIHDAELRTEMIRAARSLASMDHHILHRCDVWTPLGFYPLMNSMRQSPIQAMSLNDHTPGQGQYRDLEAFKRNLIALRASDPNFDADADIRNRIAARAEDTETVSSILGRVQTAYQATPFVLASHDDDSADKVSAMHELGCTITEFPVLLEAARRGLELGHWITVGAPNIVRGGSTSGNQDAMELAQEGLADIICADYHLPSMITSAWMLVRNGVCTLPEAVAMLTVNPAQAFGLTDRGRLEVGLAADLALVEVIGERPVVQATLFRGRTAFRSSAAGAMLAGARA